MSLLTIVKNACARISQPQPSAVIGSTDRQVIQMLALTIQAARELARDADWQALVEEKTFTTTATPSQAAALPTDFDRFIPNSFWNRSSRRPISGPLTPQEWQTLQALPVYSSPFISYRERTGEFLFTPTPAAGNTVAYEYVSLNWAKSALGVAQSTYLADTDLTFLDESLIEDSLVWRFLRAKGLDYSEEMATFERNKEKAVGRDGGSSALNLAPQPINLARANVPEGSFPGS